MTFFEKILDLEVPSAVRISPDQQHIVYTTCLAARGRKSEHAVSTIWLAPAKKAKSARQLTSGLFADCKPKWSPNGRDIAFLSDRVERGRCSTIYILSLDGGEPYPITPTTNEQSIIDFEFSPDGSSIAFLSSDEKTDEQKAKEKAKDDAHVWGEDWPYTRLRLLDVTTKTVTTVVSCEADIFTFAWNDSGSKITYATVASPDLESCDVYGTDICMVDLDEKKSVVLCHFPTYIGDLVASNGSVYFVGQATDTEIVSGSMVYRVPSENESVPYEKYDYGVDDCAKALAVRHGSIMTSVQHGMENILQVLRGPTALVTTKEIHAWDVAYNAKEKNSHLAVALSSVNKPPEVYWRGDAGETFIQLSTHSRAFDGHEFGSRAFLSCRSSDNAVDLDAVWHAPPGATPGKLLPTIVHLHGGPYDRRNDSFDNTAFMWGPLFLSAGFAMLSPNYRGSSSRGDQFAAYARGAGKYDYEDVVALTQHAIEQGYADPNRLVVGGWSFGGFLTQLCAVRNGLHGHGWKFQAAFPGAGVVDMDAASMTSDMGIWKARLGGQAPWQSERTYTGNRQSSALWEFHSAVKHGSVIPPMLLMHAEFDERTGIEQSRAMHRALQSARLPYEFVMYPREAHMPSERQHLVDMGTRIVRFVEKHIGKGDIRSSLEPQPRQG